MLIEIRSRSYTNFPGTSKCTGNKLPLWPLNRFIIMSKKKSAKIIQLPQSPEKYFTSGKARKLPIYECLISESWEDTGMTPIIVARKHVNGNLSWGGYLVDTFCLGIKNTLYMFNESEEVYESFKEAFSEDFDMEACDYVLVHNVIYGAIEYAEDYGFKPHKEFDISKYALEEDDERVELMELEFGFDGKPCYFSGPDEDQAEIERIIATLERTAGEGNYTIFLGDEMKDESDEESEEDEEFLPFFEEGELEQIMKGEKEPDPFQSFVLAESIYSLTFPEEKSGIGIERSEDLGLEELLDEMNPEDRKYFPSEKEGKAIEESFSLLAEADFEKRLSVVEENIARFPHIYYLYQLWL